jgi:hypothetical protein
MTPRTRRLVLLSGWLLLQKPAGWTDSKEPPLDRWTQVKHFSSSGACESYRDKAVAGTQDPSAAGSMRCVAEEPAQKAPAKAGGW